MIIKILVAVAVIIVVVAIVATFRPSAYRIVRTATFTSSPASVFAQTNDLHKYIVWNPFGKSDPAAQYTFEGPAAGLGSTLAWSSKDQTGEDRMTIVDSRPDELVRYRLDFFKPFAGTADATFTFKSQGNQTAVTWSMEGKNTYIAKLFGLFVSMDKMIGGAFEKGLAELKTITEAEAKR
jgi:Polyketide cyclase / dehydrase and lipid transport